MQEFDGIRPYSDEETTAAFTRLVQDPEFIDLIARFKSPRLSRWFPRLVRMRVKAWMHEKFGGLTRIDDIQAQLSSHVAALVDKTTTRVTQSGLERLDKQSAYLFISNHRDIVFDPMVVNYLLYSQGFSTTRIAIGDNLLQNRLFAELMRLNKSFIVRRNMTSPREMRDAYLLLSSFICHSIDTNHSIWIAQREGRAKNGIDQTDPAIIKMFYMCRKKSGLAFDEAMNRMHIVPVSISYEYDPCDADKARELEARAREGSYTKTEGEDTEQILKGLTGFKGRVHVHFGSPIKDSPDNPKALATRIDNEMNANYHLHASNLVAYQQRAQQDAAHGPADMLAGLVTADTWSDTDLAAAEEHLNRRLNACAPAQRPYLRDMYANPVASALKAQSGSEQ
ncbi:1-acyl-sn-glycerol-3-phosphate acyltransferase [Marinobacter sp. X15-166B]|uniref:1-acyl-sn-glycerol-3-phosphate acyltransferase n=1 Tax=Marinobacter sp. X15-166B TaxID=1897620 RepID=UPI00085C519A|nr:1-acyl-sn-glycerol-3-phosphate acyltransferase [Marinobacter sp. X15-166B]OEY67596.1 glycerol acyltransferase [Marinobacter sp. X15-166B]